MNDDYDYVFKILKAGDSKSGLLARVVDDPESNAYSLKDSAGVDSKIKTVRLNGKTFKLQIFEFSEQGQFKIFRSSYQFMPDGIIIVYDVTAIESFNKAKKWLEGNDKYDNDNVCMILIGNNCYMNDNDEEKVVKTTTAEELASRFVIPFFEISAENPTELEKVLSEMADCIKTYKIDKSGAVQMGRKPIQQNNMANSTT